MGDTRLVDSFFGAGKHKPPSVLLDTRGLVVLMVGRWGYFFLLKMTSCRGRSVKVGKVAPGVTSASVVTKFAEMDVPRTIPRKLRRMVTLPNGVRFE